MSKQTTDLMNDVYNLIIDPETKAKEREILVAFKNEYDESHNKEKLTLEMLESLRRLAVSNINTEETMSSNVASFYQKLATSKEWDKNLAKGLISLSLF